MSKLEEALEKANQLRESNFDATEINQIRESPVPIKTERRKLSDLPELKTKKVDSQYIVTVNQPEASISEEYRRLKSMLIRETKADFLNSIMITSSVDSEGKTITAINLAVSLAQELDHSVLLIDADLRKPMIHEYLGIKYEYGLSDYLTKDIDISEALIKTGIGNMVFLPAGHAVQNPVELLSSDKMKSLISDLKHRYMDRYVIIDTPPILSCSEGIVIGSYVDGLIFVVREGHAQKKVIENALNMIQGINMLGVVFNNVSETNRNSRYSNYYRYNYKSGRKKDKEK